MSRVKEINVKNRTHIKSRQIKSHSKNILIYHIGEVTVKTLFFLSNNFHVLQTSATNKMKMKIQYKI